MVTERAPRNPHTNQPQKIPLELRAKTPGVKPNRHKIADILDAIRKHRLPVYMPGVALLERLVDDPDGVETLARYVNNKT